MSWLHTFRKLASEEELFGDPSKWQPGQVVILSNTGVTGFAVVRVLDWEQVTQLSDDYQTVDENTILAPNPFGSMTHNRGDSVPVISLGYFGGVLYRGYDEGKVMIVGAQNLFRTLGDLMKYDLRLIYPDLLMSIMSYPHIREFQQRFPQLMGESIFQMVNYESYHVLGYSVIAVRDPRRSGSYKQSEWYWSIPELNTRSLNMSHRAEDIKDPQLRRAWSQIFGQGGHYNTPDEAVAAAEKYIDVFVLMSDVDVSAYKDSQVKGFNMKHAAEWKIEQIENCPCGSNQPSWWIHDCKGSRVAKVCEKCEDKSCKKYRPDIFVGDDD